MMLTRETHFRVNSRLQLIIYYTTNIVIVVDANYSSRIYTSLSSRTDVVFVDKQIRRNVYSIHLHTVDADHISHAPRNHSN